MTEHAMDDLYLIWSNEHRAWWGPGERGYVRSLAAAGRYSRPHALSICTRAVPGAVALGMFAELPVRLADVEQFIAGMLIPTRLVE